MKTKKLLSFSGFVKAVEVSYMEQPIREKLRRLLTPSKEDLNGWRHYEKDGNPIEIIKLEIELSGNPVNWYLMGELLAKNIEIKVKK